MFKCPHCNEEGISWLGKIFLGPVRTIKCKKCNGKVSVPYGKTFLFSLPIVIVLIFIMGFLDGLIEIIAILGLFILGILSTYQIPLIKK